MNRLLLICLLLSALALPTLAQDETTPSGTPAEICEAATTEEPVSRDYAEVPEMMLEADVDYRAVMCTQAGPVYIDLYEDYAPLTVNNFVALAQDGYYNNTTFHRVLEGFMAQGGDPLGTGTGGPGYQFQDEFVGFLTFEREGLLAMANTGPDTNGSQFFITFDPTTHLNFRHTIFGEVLQGQDNIEGLTRRDPLQEPDSEGDALATVVIVTDPAAVDSSFEDTRETASAEDIATGLEGLVPQLPPDLAFNADVSGTFTTDEVIASVPEDLQAAFADLVQGNNHDFRVTREITSTECNPQYFFSTLTYTVDAFGNAADAQNVVASEGLSAFNEALGYEPIETPDRSNTLAFRQQADTCAGEPGQAVRVVLQRGRYMATVDALVSQAVFEQAGGVLNLGDVVSQLFEPLLGDAYLAELR